MNDRGVVVAGEERPEKTQTDAVGKEHSGSTKKLIAALGTAASSARGVTSESRAQERHRRVALSAAAAATAKLVSIAAALISMPLTVHYLGAERFGMWMTMSSLITALSFADLGMANGILNSVAESNGRDDRLAIRAIVSNGFFVLSIIAGTILLLFAAAYPFVPWFEIFNVKSELARLEAGPALAGFVVCFALGIPLGIVQRVQMGLQQGFASSLWQCIGSILGLLGVLIVIRLEGGLPWLVLSVFGVPLAAHVLNNAVFFGAMEPDLAPRKRFISRHVVARIARIGLLFLVLQMAVAVAFGSDNIVIAQSIGAAAVTNYAFPEKMFSLISTVLTVVLSPLWPAYGEAIARGDGGWARRTLIRSFFAAIGTAAVLSSVLVFFGTLILEFWSGRAVYSPFTLLLALGLWKVIEAGSGAASMFLNGANLIRPQVAMATSMAVVAITLKVLLVPQIGISGVVWATIFAVLLCEAVPTFVLIRKTFHWK